MEVTPGYKQTEVGVIPQDWNVMSLGSLARGIYRGASPRPIDSPVWFQESSRIGWVRISDVTQSGRYLIETTQRLSPQGARSSRFVPTGSLIMSICATVGRPIETHIDVCIHDGFVVFESPRAVQGFLYHVLKQLEPRWSSKGQTGSQMNLNTGLIKGTLVPIPSGKAEQEAIAETLSDADALIESLEQLLAKKRQLKQGAMQELLTGKKRLPGFNDEWQETTLASICSMKSGEAITSANIDQFSIYPVYGGNGLRGFTSRFTHDGNYALIGRQGALCGNTFGVEGKFFASEHAVVVTAFTRTDVPFLTYMLGRMNLNQYSESSAQPGLSVSKLLNLPITVPMTKTEQTAIAVILSDMDAEIAALEAKLVKSSQLKQGMMQELLTGRIRLPLPEAMKEA